MNETLAMHTVGLIFPKYGLGLYHIKWPHDLNMFVKWSSPAKHEWHEEMEWKSEKWKDM